MPVPSTVTLLRFTEGFLKITSLATEVLMVPDISDTFSENSIEGADIICVVFPVYVTDFKFGNFSVVEIFPPNLKFSIGLSEGNTWYPPVSKSPFTVTLLRLLHPPKSSTPETVRFFLQSNSLNPVLHEKLQYPSITTSSIKVIFN